MFPRKSREKAEMNLRCGSVQVPSKKFCRKNWKIRKNSSCILKAPSHQYWENRIFGSGFSSGFKQVIAPALALKIFSSVSNLRFRYYEKFGSGLFRLFRNFCSGSELELFPTLNLAKSRVALPPC